VATTTNRSSGTQITKRGVNQGNVLVDPVSGLPISVIEDSDGKKRLCVDAILEVGTLTVGVDLNSNDDQVAVEDPNTGAHIRVESDGSINVNTSLDASGGDNVAISGHPNAIFDEKADSIAINSFKEIYRFVSTDNLTRISAVECTVSTSSLFMLKINGATVRSLRSSPIEKNVTFAFREPRPLPSGSILTVEARVDRFIQSSYITFTSLEGYLD
jgi:hypothetical protein